MPKVCGRTAYAGCCCRATWVCMSRCTPASLSEHPHPPPKNSSFLPRNESRSWQHTGIVKAHPSGSHFLEERGMQAAAAGAVAAARVSRGGRLLCGQGAVRLRCFACVCVRGDRPPYLPIPARPSSQIPRTRGRASPTRLCRAAGRAGQDPRPCGVAQRGAAARAAQVLARLSLTLQSTDAKGCPKFVTASQLRRSADRTARRADQRKGGAAGHVPLRNEPAASGAPSPTPHS